MPKRGKHRQLAAEQFWPRLGPTGRYRSGVKDPPRVPPGYLIMSNFDTLFDTLPTLSAELSLPLRERASSDSSANTVRYRVGVGTSLVTSLYPLGTLLPTPWGTPSSSRPP